MNSAASAGSRRALTELTNSLTFMPDPPSLLIVAALYLAQLHAVNYECYTAELKRMRTKTADIPMRTMRTPERGALRSYTSRGGVFVLSRLLPTKHSSTGAWRLTHQPSGAVSLVTSYGEGVQLIRRLQTTPALDEGAAQRFVILPRPEPMNGVVLFDRATGRWFPRWNELPVQQSELEHMALLQPARATDEVAGVVLTEWQMEIELVTASAPADRQAARPVASTARVRRRARSR